MRRVTGILVATAVPWPVLVACNRDRPPDSGASPAATGSVVVDSSVAHDRVSVPVSSAVASAPAQGTAVVRAAAVVGIAGTMGTDPLLMVVIRPAAGDPVQVDGPLSAEVGRVTGATVALFGEVRAGSPWRVIAPVAYEILAIDGQKPHVGTLVIEGAEVWLEADSSLRLEGVPESLRRERGAKVYVIGPVRGGGLSVSSYGVIRRTEQ